MQRLRSILGYSAAVAVLAATFLTPFVLLPRFTRLVGGLGVRPHPKFAGGPVRKVLDRGSYLVALSAPAGPVGWLERTPRFVQVSFSPVGGLPERVEERLDLDGDGADDVRLAFSVPKDPARPLSGRVDVLNPAKVLPVAELGRGKLTELLVRLDERIVARIPVR